MKSLRLGLIGLGNIGRHHATYLLAGKVPRCELVAVCSTTPAKMEAYRPLAPWTDARALVASGTVDAVLVATPHYQHTDLGIAALDAGVHLMVEKPISAHKADALKLIAAHERNPKTVFGGMFQLRVEPRYQKLRYLIESGELGRIVRVNWINTDWYRTDAYYASGGWRATWAGEGGGVLLNHASTTSTSSPGCWGCPRRCGLMSPSVAITPSRWKTTSRPTSNIPQVPPACSWPAPASHLAPIGSNSPAPADGP